MGISCWRIFSLLTIFLGLRETGQTHGGETLRGILKKKEETLFSAKGFSAASKAWEGASVSERASVSQAHPPPNPQAQNAHLEFLQLNNQRNCRLGGFIFLCCVDPSWGCSFTATFSLILWKTLLSPVLQCYPLAMSFVSAVLAVH